MNGIVFPSTLTALYVIFSNPIVMAAALSMALEKTSFIQNKERPNWQKLTLVLLVAVAWALLVSLLSTNGLDTTPQGMYAVLVAGIGMAAAMSLTNQLVSDGMPWFKNFLLTLFGKNVVTVTASSSTSSGATVSSVTTQPTATLDSVGLA